VVGFLNRHGREGAWRASIRCRPRRRQIIPASHNRTILPEDHQKLTLLRPFIATTAFVPSTKGVITGFGRLHVITAQRRRIPGGVSRMSTDTNDEESKSVTNETFESVNATTVTMSQAAARQITAERLSMTQASAKKIDARSAQLDHSSVFRLKAENAVLNRSAATFVDANEARLVNVNAFIVRGNTNAVEGDLKAVLHIGDASGNVHTILDKNSAMSLGAGFGAATVVLGFLARKLFR